MLEERAKDVGELLAGAKKIAESWRKSITDPQELWFRGQPRLRYELLPGLYRTTNTKYHYHEPTLYLQFTSLAAPHAMRRPADEWEWYFLAQHYGLPTRLLDWTESLTSAAYFAICGDVLCRDRLAVDSDLAVGRQPEVYDDDSPVVWILDAGSLNRATVGEDIVLFPGGDRTERYRPESFGSAAGVAEDPIAIFAPRTNVRIAAQQGVFTVHGSRPVPLEQFVSEPKGSSIQLGRVVLDRANLSFLWEELCLLGVGRLALFPDLDSVAAHVKWRMQSAV